MPTTPSPPPAALRGFVCGTLSDPDAEGVAEWVDIEPQSEDALRRVPVKDTLLDVLSTVADTQLPPDPTADRLVRSLSLSLVGVAATNPQPVPAPTRDSASDTVVRPARLGNYRLVRELGRGGMGVVYEAIDERLGRPVAVKVLHPDLVADPVSRQRFLRECKSAAAIDSEHVVRIYQADEIDGVLLLAMEFVEGQSLEAWLKAKPGPATADEVMWVARQLLTGLVALHKLGLTHRDIKPHNAMVEIRDGEPGRVKLLDFGLTRSSRDADAITHPDRVVGTPAYMAPEQAGAKPPDPKCDLFSLGVVLYRMVDGDSPFQREAVLPTLAAVVSYEPPPLEGVPPEVNDFIFRLLAKNPDQRPGTAEALAQAVLIEKGLIKPELGQPWGRLRIAAGFTALLMLAAAVVVIGRDKNGKELWRKTVPDGGTIVVAPDEKPLEKPDKSTVKPPPATTPAVPRPTEVQVGAKVRVTKEAVGYADTRQSPHAFVKSVPVGTRGQVVELADDAGLCKILLDGRNFEVWVSRTCVEVE